MDNRLNQTLINYSSLITIVSFLIALVIGGVVLWPKFQELKTLGKIIEEKKNELQSTEEYVSELKKIDADLTEYQDELAKIGFALPDNPSVPSLFNFIQTSASQSGLILEKIGSFSISSADESAAVKQIFFDITVAGSYSSFKNFLSVLEQSAKLIEVEGFSFSSTESEIGAAGEKGKGKEAFSIDLRLKTQSY